MKRYNQPVEMIIQQMPGRAGAKGKLHPDATKAVQQQLKAAGIPVSSVKEPAPEIAVRSASKFKTTMTGNIYVKTKISDTEVNPWDVAHMSRTALNNRHTFVEPDFLQEFTINKKINDLPKKINAKSFGSDTNDHDADWPPDKNIIWHLDDAWSQLKKARESVQDNDALIRIAHLDTGYSATHFIVPGSVKNNKLQRNFVDGEKVDDAHDPLTSGFLKMPGHGTGTLGILAGNTIDLRTDNGRFNDYLGAAWFAEVICCRIAASVVLLKTSAFAEALNYITRISTGGTPVHVASMSMGGAPSASWAKAVNAAYEAGITLVTAAGNNFNGLPTRHVIYPARFGRVIAACGVTYNMQPYASLKPGEMQGCFGPKRHMKKALAAFTPNVPWAGTAENNIRFNGSGTSCAAPQIAAAAAIYYRQHYTALSRLKPWQRVEAIRFALYTSAKKMVRNAPLTYNHYFGNGILQSNDALSIGVKTNLTKTPEDQVPWFPVLSTIFKTNNAQSVPAIQMYNTELAQLVYTYPELSALIDDENRPYEKIGIKKWKHFTTAVIAHPGTSVALKKILEQARI
ncbi:S8/S53 family peptidase [Agriterribacter sp.]|uniref:S8/S53 family peptidase n=1 Tax=Agriterribacter sp. TaxID=2821509 RepID=UPI002BD64288|nr:S8/S53 family peptidase [Agriterribacter sp.]HRO48297.1 S8/S53 family peptidase [Agriterribacter sp.]HRQ19273.1 S8/S53 family peptidase [Agriterribacter sp.]